VETAKDLLVSAASTTYFAVQDYFVLSVMLGLLSDAAGRPAAAVGGIFSDPDGDLLRTV